MIGVDIEDDGTYAVWSENEYPLYYDTRQEALDCVDELLKEREEAKR